MATLACAAAALPAWPQAPQRLQIETRKVEGTENVYIFRNGNHQAMFVVTKEGVIATDPVAYGRPQGGAQYVAEIRKVTQAPIRYLVYSHHHYDTSPAGRPSRRPAPPSWRTSARKSASSACRTRRRRYPTRPSSGAAPCAWAAPRSSCPTSA